jgi:tetratricopeptide (TPR) repeat protein
MQSKALENKILAYVENQTNDSDLEINESPELNKKKSINPSLLDEKSTGLSYKTDVRNRLEQARLFLKDNKASAALKSLQNFDPEEPDLAEYHFLTGRAYQELKLNTKALSSYSIAIHLDSMHYKALNNRGLIKGALRDMTGAIDDLNKSIEANSKYAPAYMNRGVTRAAMKNVDLAIEDFTKAILIDPLYADAFRNRGITYKFTGNIQGACRDWQKASQLGETSTNNWINRHCKP